MEEKHRKQVEALINAILSMLAEHDTTEVKFTEATDCTVIDIIPHPEDCGRLIGVKGRVAFGIQLLMSAFSARISRTIYCRVVADESDRRERNDKPKRRRDRIKR